MSEKTEGKVDEAKGKAKQAAGDVTGDDSLHREGKADEKSGEARQKVGDAADKVGDGISDATDKAKDAMPGGDK